MSTITYNCAMKSSVVVYICEKLSRKLKKMVRHLQFVYFVVYFVVRVMVKPIVAEPVLYRYWTTLVYLRLLL